jgi:hypothetical protein
MPSVKEFKKSQHSEKSEKKEIVKKATLMKKTSTAKRRPGRDQEFKLSNRQEEKMDNKKINEKSTSQSQAEVQTHAQTHAQSENPTQVEAAEPHSMSDAEYYENERKVNEPKKVEISFFGSEVLRAKLPKPFEIAEQVATEWVNDGKFDDVKIGHPVADALAQQGLQKAKEIEKKVVESGVLDKVAMQALTFGLKAQEEINKIRDQVKNKMGKK